MTYQARRLGDHPGTMPPPSGEAIRSHVRTRLEALLAALGVGTANHGTASHGASVE
ncbi:hypothetical protein [Methylobacterium nonmethylotrophicum]|uniref:hypothetical protein n=1 Tax=Methylobacterium nonmethylotrophicum TaxID=1141884 RepID=UPI001436B866|nr:hypothetical protein [Methylobacterium nonmethylotrophicum]